VGLFCTGAAAVACFLVMLPFMPFTSRASSDAVDVATYGFSTCGNELLSRGLEVDDLFRNLTPKSDSCSLTFFRFRPAVAHCCSSGTGLASVPCPRAAFSAAS